MHCSPVHHKYLKLVTFFLIIQFLLSDEIQNRARTDHRVFFFHVYCHFQYHADTVVFMKELSKHMYDNDVVIHDELRLQLKSLAKIK